MTLHFYIFNSAWQQCIDLNEKVQVFIIQKIIKWEVWMIEMFCFLQMKAEIQAYPCIFFNSAQT